MDIKTYNPQWTKIEELNEYSIKKLFVQFLKYNNALHKYKINRYIQKKDIQRPLTHMPNTVRCCIDMMMSSFVWCETNDGNIFWYELNNAWNQSIESYGTL